MKNEKMKYILSFSGGKDSTAMLFRLIELNYQIDEIIFADTGFEFPEIYEHIDQVEKVIGRSIIKLKTNILFHDWASGKITRGKNKGMIRGLPLKYYPCWWSRESKFKVLDQYIGHNNRYIGIAYDEQKRIRDHKGYIYPLNDLKMSENDCIIYLKSINQLKPIHTKFKHTGCYWCPKQSQRSLDLLEKDYPDLYKKRCELFKKYNYEKGKDK